jgi:mRNA interferase MazF
MRTWDVVILRYPFNDGTSAKQRPAVVVSKDPYHTFGQDGLFMLITSNVSRCADYDVLIDSSDPEFPATGLIKSSAIRVDKIMNLQHTLVCRHLGILGPISRGRVREKLGELWNI